MESIFSLRRWLDEVKKADMLVEVKGANVLHEIGVITEINARSEGQKALHFKEIPNFDPQFGVVSSTVLNPETLGLSLNLKKRSNDKLEYSEMVAEALAEGEKNIDNYKIQYVETGPVMENQKIGDDVDITIFPSPIWHEHDGGPYIGTGGVQIHEDPESGWINIGTYRMHALNKKNIGNYIIRNNHGNQIREKYWAMGKPAPVVVVAGMHPVFHVLGSTGFPPNMNELDLAGALFKQSVPVIKGPITGLPIPADAEIAIEGFVYPDEKMMEGEFAEFTGYYGGGESMQPYIVAKAMYYRNGANILGSVPGKPPHDFSFMSSTVRAAVLKDQLQKAGILGVRGVWPLECGASRVILVISLKQLYPGHANQALLVSGGCNPGSMMTRYCIVVDEDIDPSDPEQVLWAMSFRADPSQDIDIVRQTFSLRLDPLLTEEDKAASRTVTSRALINACIPYDRLNTFSKVAASSPELMNKIKKKWGSLWK